MNDADGTLVAYEILNWEGLSGTAYPNSTVTLISTYDVTGGYEAYEASVSADGKWSIDQAVVGAIPPDGQFSLSVTSKDSSGTVSDPAIASLIFDLGTAGTDFAAPTINLHDADGVITPSEFTNWSGVSGTAAANSTVIMVSTDKATGAKGTLLFQADTNGDWSWSPTTDQVQSQASSYDLSVTYTDNVDKISAAATTTLAFSDGTGPVNATPTGTVSISGTTTEGQVLTVDTASLADADGLGTLSYQWLRDGADISGATSKTYTLAQADVGAAVSARVSYTDGGGTAESVSSAVTQAIVASPPTVVPFDIVLASESGGVASFEIYADASVDPQNDGFGSLDMVINHDPTDMLIDMTTFTGASPLFGMPNKLSDGEYAYGAFGLDKFTDLSSPIVTFDATILDTDNPIVITLSGLRVESDSHSNVSETFDFTSVDVKSTVANVDGDQLSGVTVSYNFETPSGEQKSAELVVQSASGVSHAMPRGSDATIKADKSVDTTSEDAISAFDALQALRLAVGLDKSDGTSEWHDYIAADINKDGRVGADDALNILKYAVGLTDGPSADWVFVDKNADWSGIDRSTTTYNEGIQLSDITSDTSIDMTGILVGDVDGSYIA